MDVLSDAQGLKDEGKKTRELTKCGGAESWGKIHGSVPAGDSKES